MVRIILFLIPLFLVCHPGSTHDIGGAEKLPARVQEILNGSNKDLTFIGSFGSKFYFTDSVITSISWTAADTYCKSDSMQLATPRNPDELQYLIQQITAARRWWTSGRNVNQFEWSDGTAIDYTIATPHSGCVLLAGTEILEEPCDGSLNPTQPLCELINDL